MSLNLATLGNGNAVTITIQATLSTTVGDGATLANTPSVTSSTPDPDTSNNSGSAGSASITVQNKSDLLVTTKSNVDAVNLGGTIIYAVTVTNLGPFQASAVTWSMQCLSSPCFCRWTRAGPPVRLQPLAQSRCRYL